MTQPDSVATLKQKNRQLEEALMHYKGENVDLQRRMTDLEDEIRDLKEKLQNYYQKNTP